MGKTLYLDVLCGISGDMFLSALVDAGASLDYCNSFLAKTGVPGLTITAEKQQRSGIACTHINVTAQTEQHYRHLPDIIKCIKASGCSNRVFAQCENVLTVLGNAEAKVHGIAIDKVHFHEIGAVDTIADILGVCCALENLGIDEVLFSTLTDGHGTMVMDHGTVPVPVPAVAAMIPGLRVQTLDIAAELVTPTGAALLIALGSQSVLRPTGIIQSTGYGCGTKTFEHHPNALRATIIDTTSNTSAMPSVDRVAVLETDMDHISGEVLGNVAERLLALGALDVSYGPIFMKKGRPGYRLTVISSEQQRENLIDCIMIHTRTLGVRYSSVNRVIAHRTITSNKCDGVTVQEKYCTYKNHSFTKLEYESLCALSEKTEKSLLDCSEEYLRKNPQK